MRCGAAELQLGPGSLARASVPQWCEHIDLSYSALGPQRASRLAEALASEGGRVSTLNLTWAALGLEGFAALLASLARASRLEVLDLKGNWLGDVGAHMLTAAVVDGRLRRLGELHLRWNSFSQSGAAALSRAMAHMPSLRVIDVGGNWMQDVGLAAVVDAAAQLASLSVLRLDSNEEYPGSAMMPAIKRLLTGSTLLRTLELSSNHIDEDGIRHLVDGLHSNAGLQLLDLSFNKRIGDTSSRALAHALKSHPSIMHVDLRGTTLRNEGADALLDAFHASRVLSRLQLEPSYIRQGETNETEPRIAADRLLRLRQLNDSRLAAGLSDAPACNFTNATIAKRREEEYWRQVYPVAAEARRSGPLLPRVSGPPNFFYVTAPPTLLESGCESHSWAMCRLDNYFARGEMPHRIPYGTVFSPFRMAPGACVRNKFRWDYWDVDAWKREYPYSAGVPDNSWVEIAHTREQNGGAWLYLSAGSGVFWNCGRSLRARNKVDAALSLLQQLHQVDRQQALRRLADGIQADDATMCDDDHCRTFMSILRANRTDRNDNCYGRCSLSARPLHEWLHIAASGIASREWWYDHMSASSVFDMGLLKWAKRLRYHSVQLTMQPQVWCGLSWTTEILDLRVRRHRIMDLVPHLSLRDPAELSRGMPCIVRSDNLSRKAFMNCVYCEGTIMERVSRCLADVSGGKHGFTIYSRYPRYRFEECLSGARRTK